MHNRLLTAFMAVIYGASGWTWPYALLVLATVAALLIVSTPRVRN